MTTPTINPGELTQDSVKKTFVKWVEKGLGLAAGSMQATVNTLFAQAATSQRRADLFKAQVPTGPLSAERMALQAGLQTQMALAGNTGPANTARFTFFAAFDGTNNDRSKVPSGSFQTNAANLAEQADDDQCRRFA